MKVCSRCKVEKPIEAYSKRSARCKPCATIVAVEWAKANPEKVKANQSKHRESHMKENAAKLDAWRKANPEKARAQWERANSKRRKPRCYVQRTDEELRLMANERRRRYSKAHPHKISLNLANRRAAKYSASPSWANSFFIAEAYRLAKLREQMTGIKWHVDHIVPLRNKLVCGLHVEYNLQVIPASINYRKSNTFWPDMPI